jgi:quercetin dioxygenase-like cupin family protein
MPQRLFMPTLAAVAALALPTSAQTVLPVEQTPYHVPVFTNDYVTVLNVFVPPQRTSGYHRHSLDSLGVLIGDTDRTGQVLGAKETPTPRRDPGAVNFTFYHKEPAVHTITIKGDAPFHNIVVELVRPTPYGFKPGSRDGAAGYAQVLDNERVRVWRLVLAPGAEAPAITQAAPGIRIVVAGGEIVERIAGRPDRGIAPHAGEFFWQDAGVTRAVRNAGATRVELVEVELK